MVPKGAAASACRPFFMARRRSSIPRPSGGANARVSGRARHYGSEPGLQRFSGRAGGGARV